jgi:hypothetical protein
MPGRLPLTLVALFLISCSSREAAPVTVQVASDPVRITQFYAPSSIARGEKTNLCYGVENARSVRISPEVEKIGPALARCIPVSPVKTTTYTLAATDAAGHEVPQTVNVSVGPPLPRIVEVSINKTTARPGENIVLCYKAANAVSVDAGPGNYLTVHDPSHGCLSHKPAETTTYHVRVKGAGGQTDTEQVTVNVK